MLKKGDKKFNSKQSKILTHLIEKGFITVKEAYELYNTYNLASIINVLRKQGYKITTIPGTDALLTVYRMETENEVEILGETKDKDFYTIIGIFKCNDGVTMACSGKLFTSEEEAVEYGEMGKKLDTDMISYQVQKMQLK